MTTSSAPTHSLRLQPYQSQLSEWPDSGRHIMAQFDDASIVVYQAYRPSIASYAVEHQRFGGEFSFSRMSWIKPNFLWMMFRSGWATKEGQERILAIHLRRSFFDEMLLSAVASSFGASGQDSLEAWKLSLAKSTVRSQWDPDHDPQGNAVERRAIQLGLKGESLRRYGCDQLLKIEDITPLVEEQRQNVENPTELLIPVEQVYQPPQSAAQAIGLSARHC